MAKQRKTAQDLRGDSGKTSLYRGVSWNTHMQKWVALAPAGGGRQRRVYKGDDPEAAARAYDEAVKNRCYASGIPYPTNLSLGLIKGDSYDPAADPTP